ncbi:MAG: hypothetical protein R3E86_04815 [Pseudomonadales bacterium]
MELTTLADMGEFLGGLGVIVSLIYLALQIRSNTAAQRSENYARSLERMAAMQELLAREHGFTKLYNQGLFDPAALTFTQRTQFTWVLTELFGNLEFMYYQASCGNIPDELWARWIETLKWWLTFPGVLAWWRGRPTPFTPGFSQCVEDCIARGYQPENPGAWEQFMGTATPARSTEQSV